MKKTLLIAAAAIFSASAFAQTVTSANIVGYVKIEATNGFQIVASQFDGTNNTLESLIGDALPEGSKVYKYDKTAQGYAGIAEYKKPFGATEASWDQSLDLSEGSFWVQTPAAQELMFSGEVSSSNSVSTTLAPGFNLVTYPYPVEVSIDDLDITPAEGDKIYKYSPSSQGYAGISEYKKPFGATEASWDQQLTFKVGEGFWYYNSATTENVWVEARPF